MNRIAILVLAAGACACSSGGIQRHPAKTPAVQSQPPAEQPSQTLNVTIPLSPSERQVEAAIEHTSLYPSDLQQTLANLETLNLPSQQARRATFEVSFVALSKGNAQDALPVINGLLESDSNATWSAHTLAHYYLSKNEPAKASRLCSELLNRERYAQALACVDGGGVAVDERIRWEVVSSQSSLTARDLRALNGARPSSIGNSLQQAVEYCDQGNPLQIDWNPANVLGVAVEDGTARLLSLLAENAGSETARTCLLGLSAVSCIRDIQNTRECPSTFSLASYARVLFTSKTLRADEQLLHPEEFVGTLYQGKAGSYAKPDSHQARLTLLQVHLALAEIYKAKASVDQFGHDWHWHLKRAESLWGQLYVGKPFPPAIIQQIESTGS